MWSPPDRRSRSVAPRRELELEDELRMHAVHAFGALGDSPRPELEGLARLAARVCGTPWASINLIDSEHQWSPASHGVTLDAVPRRDSMCARTIDAGLDRVATADAASHELFSDNPFVVGERGHVRTYASAVIRATDGSPLGSICVFADESIPIDEEQMDSLTDLAASACALLELDRRASRLALLATIDPLTGVLNRRGFEDAVLRLASQARRREVRPGALMFDLDAFKGVNDRLGHAAGDELLRLVCARLVAATRQEDVVARLGGDELAVLLPMTDDRSIEVTRRRLLAALERPTSINGTSYTPRASCGVAVWQGDDDQAEDVLERADADMYREKARGPERVAGWGA